jgi:hypothetical protein
MMIAARNEEGVSRATHHPPRAELEGQLTLEDDEGLVECMVVEWWPRPACLHDNLDDA